MFSTGPFILTPLVGPLRIVSLIGITKSLKWNNRIRREKSSSSLSFFYSLNDQWKSIEILSPIYFFDSMSMESTIFLFVYRDISNKSDDNVLRSLIRSDEKKTKENQQREKAMTNEYSQSRRKKVLLYIVSLFNWNDHVEMIWLTNENN